MYAIIHKTSIESSIIRVNLLICKQEMTIKFIGVKYTGFEMRSPSLTLIALKLNFNYYNIK